eukprot:scaffold69727_cov62-Phaeocystis_antarctica.AAC.2
MRPTHEAKAPRCEREAAKVCRGQGGRGVRRAGSSQRERGRRGAARTLQAGGEAVIEAKGGGVAA